MGKKVLAASLILGMATAAHAGIVITLKPIFKGPPQPGEMIPVDVLLSSERDTIEFMRDFQFDLADNIPGGQFANEIFVDPKKPDAWQWSPPMSGPGWFTDDPLPIPRANWISQKPERRFMIDLTPEPTKVAEITVEFKAPGFLDVTNRDDPNWEAKWENRETLPDFGGSFRSGFVTDDVRKFVVFTQEGFEPVLGGRVFIPEPATLTLLLIGAAALLRRRRFTGSV